MALDTIKTNLLASLNAMQNLKAAYGYEASNTTGKFPYATLTLRDGEGEYASTAHNLRRRGFRIRIYQELSKIGQGPQMAETIATNCIKELEDHLDANTTLSGSCNYARPVRFKAGYQDREFDTRILDIEVDAWELVTAA